MSLVNVCPLSTYNKKGTLGVGLDLFILLKLGKRIFILEND